MKTNDLDRLLAEGKIEEAANKLTEDLDKKDPTVEKKPEEACPIAINKAIEAKAEEECAEEGTDSKGVEIKEDAAAEIKKNAESKEEEDVELEPVEEKEPKAEEKLADQNLEKDHAEKAEDVSSVEIKEDAAAEVEKKAASEEETKVELEPAEEKEPKAEEKLASEELEKDHAEEADEKLANQNLEKDHAEKAEDVAPAEIKEESQISEDNLEVDPEAAKAEEKFDDGVAKPLDPEDSEKEEETAKEVDDILDSGKEDDDLEAKTETKAEGSSAEEDPADTLDNLLEFLKDDSDNTDLNEWGGLFRRKKKGSIASPDEGASDTASKGNSGAWAVNATTNYGVGNAVQQGNGIKAPGDKKDSSDTSKGNGSSSGAWTVSTPVNYGIGNSIQQGNGATFDSAAAKEAVKNGRAAIKSGKVSVNSPTSDSNNRDNSVKISEEATEEFSVDDIVSMVEEAIDRCNAKGTKLSHNTICEEVVALVEGSAALQETERDEDALTREINKYRPDFDDEGHLRKTEEKQTEEKKKDNSVKISEGATEEPSINYGVGNVIQQGNGSTFEGAEIKESVRYHSIREACMLDEEYFTTDSYSLNTADEKFSKLTEQVALLVARENNDPMYNELLKEAVYVQRLQEAICRKYHSEAEEKACKIAKKSCK